MQNVWDLEHPRRMTYIRVSCEGTNLRNTNAPITSFEAWRGAFESSAHCTRNSGKIVDLAVKSPHFTYHPSAEIMCSNVIRYFGHVSTLARKPNSPFRICKPTQIAWKRQTLGGSQTVLQRRWDHYFKSAVYALAPFLSFRMHPNHFQIT